MLYIGEQVGARGDGRAVSGHRGRPARGDEPRRDGPGRRHHRPRRVRDGRPTQRPGHLPREAARRAGRGRQRRHPAVAGREPRTGSPRRWAAKVSDITVVILDRPRHEDLIAEVRGHRRADQAHLRRRPVGRDLVRRPGHRRARGDGHRRRARGRDHRGRAALPGRRDPGAIPVPQRRGARRARRDVGTPTRRAFTAPRTSRAGEELVFSATGVTDGELLNGVRFFGGGARTHSLVMAYQPSRCGSWTPSTCSTAIGRPPSASSPGARPSRAGGRSSPRRCRADGPGGVPARGIEPAGTAGEPRAARCGRRRAGPRGGAGARGASPRDAPGGTAREFLPCCGLAAVGRLVGGRGSGARPCSQAAAGDARWRVRESVAIALQRWGDADVAAMAAEVAGGRGLAARGAGGGRGDLRAAAAATGPAVEAAVRILDAATARLVSDPGTARRAGTGPRAGAGLCVERGGGRLAGGGAAGL